MLAKHGTLAAALDIITTSQSITFRTGDAEVASGEVGWMNRIHIGIGYDKLRDSTATRNRDTENASMWNSTGSGRNSSGCHNAHRSSRVAWTNRKEVGNGVMRLVNLTAGRIQIREGTKHTHLSRQKCTATQLSCLWWITIMIMKIAMQQVHVNYVVNTCSWEAMEHKIA